LKGSENAAGNILFREAEERATFPALFAIEFDDDILKVFIASRGIQDQLDALVWTPFENEASSNDDKISDQASVQELVARFLSIGLAQYDAAYVVDTRKYNRLFASMQDILNELKRREGDQRRALLPLLDHPNVQVRMMAAHAVLAISPALAWKAFESVRDSGIFPQAADASGTLRALDNGTYVRS
jgi:hypothetical protein